MNLSLESRPDGDADTECYFNPTHRPVDLARLARYTMGNNAIEREVLELFRRQTKLYLDKLSKTTQNDAWLETIRVLKASARSIGAWSLLRTAEEAETIALSGTALQQQDILKRLAAEIDEATRFIDSIL